MAKRPVNRFIKIIKSSQWKISLLTYIVGFLCVFPILWVLQMSLKESSTAFLLPPKIIFIPILTNFINVFKNSLFVHTYINSFTIAIGATAAALLVGVPAAYSLTRFHFKGRKLLSFWILVTRMAPASAMVVAFFMILRQFKLIDTYFGLIFVYMSFNVGYVIWMMRGFILSVPIECEEASIVDGCSRFGTFWFVVLPLCIPGIVSVAIQIFIFSWNEFLYALILTRNRFKTAPIAVMTYVTNEGIKWGELTAASILIVLPVLILALSIQKYIISGLTMGAVKD
jgi:ABC-type glycerol-3-phosphate transport system permease component